MPGDDSKDRSRADKESGELGLFGNCEGWSLIYKVAGALGIDPRPFSLRELFWLYEGSDRQKWMHTAAINAMQGSAAGAKNMSITKFHPYMNTEAAKTRKQKLLEIQKKRNDKLSNKDG